MDTYKELLKENHSPIWWFCAEMFYIAINCLFSWACYVLLGQFPTIIFTIIMVGAAIEFTIVRTIGVYFKSSNDNE